MGEGPKGIEARIAAICDDLVRFHAHVLMTDAPMRLAEPVNPRAVARVQYTGDSAPTIYCSPRLPLESQLEILEFAYQVMITGAPDAAWEEYETTWEGRALRFRYLDIETK